MMFHQRSRTKFWAVVATLILGSTLTVVTLSNQTANAAAIRQCNDLQHSLCFFQDKNFNAAKPWLFMDSWDYTKVSGCQNIRSSYRNAISSIKLNPNGSKYYVYVYGYNGLNCPT